METNPNEYINPASNLTAILDTPRPVAKADRIQTIDLVRGLALLGILMMNIPGFGYLNSSIFELVKHPQSADFYTFAVVETAFSGTMRALFSMLFGAGMVLFMTNKKEMGDGPAVAEFYYRRLIWLVLFGVFNAYVLLWPGDILFFYGLCGMLLFPFRKLKPGWLIVLALTCIFINIFRNDLFYNDLRANRAGYLEAVRLEKAKKKPTAKQLEAKAAWETFEKNFKPDKKKDEKTLKERRSGYSTVFMLLLPDNSNIESWGVYFGSWDMLAMMFLGMALFGWGFFSNKLPTSTYATTLLIGYGLGLPISWFYMKTEVDWISNVAKVVDYYRVVPWDVYDLRRALLALGHASLLILVYRWDIVPWLMKALTAVGQMAFTNYLMQSIICTFIFHGYGLGYYGKLSFHELYYVVFGVWIFQLIISPIWLNYFRFGPFEWLWRSLTYWKMQPMKR